MMYVLHHVPDWASLAVHLALAELDVPFRLAAADPDPAARAAPAFRRLSPTGRIPALETPDGPMFETAAILLWLADRHRALAPTPEAPDRAAFLSWHLLAATTLHPAVLALLHAEDPAGPGCAAAVTARAAAEVRARLDLFEALAAGPAAPAWLSPHAPPSVLGLYVSMLRRWAAAFAYDPAFRVPVGLHPALSAIAAGIEARPAARRVAEAEGLPPDFLTDPRP
jgi:glutathione S-transferase